MWQIIRGQQDANDRLSAYVSQLISHLIAIELSPVDQFFEIKQFQKIQQFVKAQIQLQPKEQ